MADSHDQKLHYLQHDVPRPSVDTQSDVATINTWNSAQTLGESPPAEPPPPPPPKDGSRGATALPAFHVAEKLQAKSPPRENILLKDLPNPPHLEHLDSGLGPSDSEADPGAAHHGGMPDEDAIEPGGSSEEEGEFEFDDYVDDETSVTSSIYAHTYKNGRRYHKFRHGRYPIPNDEREQNREDMLHAMMLEATGGRLFFAPIAEHPTKILDLGTGTGIWAIEMADKYPGAEVTGLDLSPIQPMWVPPNVQFIVDDVEDTWMAGDGWDLVHMRNMVPILKSPVRVLRECFANLKPGGWVELQDVDGQVHCDDGTLPPDWPLVRFCNLLVEAFARFSTNAHAAMFGRQYLEEAGFVNIQCRPVKLPYGAWAKDKTMRVIGEYYRIACEEMFPVVGAMHLPMLGWSKEEMEVLFAQCRNGMKDRSVHAYGLMYFWSGQKPYGAGG